jgi:CDP-glycerol glycerophosphotransferase
MAEVPRISVVVPIYNVEDFLDPCLTSLAEQTVTDLDVVMVDDGSTDRSADIAREWERSDGRFRLVTRPNGGLSAARNTGADHAEGEYLAFVDSDDVLPPNAYELLLGALERTGSAFASGNVHRLTRFGASQSKFVARTFDQTRFKTHVTKFRPLLYDRTAWNKLWRRSFWEKHGFRFPEGRLYEDIPVTLPAHFLAKSVDVIADTVYLWRIREGGELSITQRRLEPRALLDRLQSVSEVSERLRSLGPRGAKGWYEQTVVADDLRYYLNALDIADDEYRALFMDRVNAYLDRASRRVFDNLPAIDRLKWYLVRKRLVPELVEVLQFEKQELASTPPVRIRGKWYGDYPFRLDRRLRIPTSVYRLEGELSLSTQIERLERDGDRLRIGGYAFIHGIGAATEDAQTVEVSALRPGPLRRVRLITSAVRARATARHRPDVTVSAYQATRDLSWAGFEAVVDAGRLRRRGSWDLYVTVRAGGTKRRKMKFAFAAPLRSVRPAAGVQTAITFEDGIVIEVAEQMATITGGRLAGDVVELTGTLLAAHEGKAALEARRESDGRRFRAPLAIDGTAFTARAKVADVLKAPPAGVDRDGVWELTLVAGGKRAPVALETPGRWRADGREIALRTWVRGAALVARTARPWVTAAEWTADGALEVRGRADGDVAWSELVLAGALWDEEHVFPFELGADGTLSATVTPAAVETAGGRLPLTRGVWELRMRVDGEPAGRPLAPAPELEDALPLKTDIDGRGFTLALTPEGRLALDVLQDVAVEDGGRYNQRRLRQAVYLPGRTAVLRDAIVYSSFQGRQCSDSPRAIHEELVRREAPFEHLWVVRDGMCRAPGTARVLRHNSRDYHEALARARYVVVNDVLPDWFERRGDQLCLQTWHGTPLKRLGFDLSERPANRRQAAAWRHQVAGWQHVLSPNGFATERLRSAFGVEGEVLETGLPRVDVLNAAGREQRARAVRRRLGIPDGARVVLYAPTYRDQVADRQGRTRLDLRLDFERLRAATGPDTVILFRKHHAIFDALPHRAWPFARDVSRYPDATELLLAVDVLVTDYSSLMVDFANTGRPMLFYAYDLERYVTAIRGLHIDAEETLPGPILRTSDEVAEVLRDLDGVPAGHAERYRAFRAAFCEHDDGRAAERVVDRLLSW